jgi:hypothetical protein
MLRTANIAHASSPGRVPYWLGLAGAAFQAAQRLVRYVAMNPVKSASIDECQGRSVLYSVVTIAEMALTSDPSWKALAYAVLAPPSPTSLVYTRQKSLAGLALLSSALC